MISSAQVLPPNQNNFSLGVQTSLNSFPMPLYHQPHFSKWNATRADKKYSLRENNHHCMPACHWSSWFYHRWVSWIPKLLRSSNCAERPLFISKSENVCYWWWQRKAGRQELCLSQKVTNWKRKLTSTIPLQAQYFLKIKTPDQILGGGPDLGFFLKPILKNAVNAVAVVCPELPVLYSHQQSQPSSASSGPK